MDRSDKGKKKDQQNISAKKNDQGGGDKLPAHLKKQKENLTCTIEGPKNANTYEYAGTFASVGHDESFNFNQFKENFEINICDLSESVIVFDLIGVDAPIANALRRILIAEVPTVAIETVQMYQNTGVIQDEVMAHRLGLVPIKCNPDFLNYRRENEEFSSSNALRFKLHVKATKDRQNVYSRDLVWEPIDDSQAQQFEGDEPAPVFPDILITKLGLNQELECIVYCEKGVGKTHAKWSPVSTASYRLLSVFDFKRGPLCGEEANELKELCPMDVFDIEEFSGHLVASNPRNCTTCMACIERFPDDVELNKKKGHFIFTIESTGCMPAVALFEKAVGVLLDKCRSSLEILRLNTES